MRQKPEFIFYAIGAIWMLFAIGFCGKSKDIVTVKLPDEPISTTCGGVPVGNHRNLVCEEGWIGSIEQECQEDGSWKTITSTCSPKPSQCETDSQTKTTFKRDIKPIITTYCISCHKAIELDTYAASKKYIDEIIRRINLDDLNRQRMPQPPQKPLSFAERESFTEWKNDGLLEDTECPDDANQEQVNFNTLDKLESSIREDLSRLDGRAKKNARYLTLDNKHNLGASADEKKTYFSGISKSINSLNNVTDDFVPCVPIDRIGGACRVDLESFGLTAVDWDLIVNNAKLVLESFTDEGLFIKQETGARVPWLTGDQFIESALGVPAVYYSIMGIPSVQADYLRLKGIDLQQDFDDFRVTCGGGVESPIGENKPRLVCFLKGDDGDCSVTFDTVDLAGDATRNLFEFPLVFVGQNRFSFNASEIICELPNGSLEHTLWNNAGQRQDAAPTNIVVDVEDPFGDFEIRVGKKCHRCHSAGWITFRDQVKSSVAQNPNINAADKELVRAIYGSQGQLEATFSTFNKKYNKTLDAVGTTGVNADPINFYADRFLKNWTLQDVCAFIRIPVRECKSRIQGSGALSAKVNSILEGGTISLDQFIDNFQVFVDELQLGKEPIEEQ